MKLRAVGMSAALVLGLGTVSLAHADAPKAKAGKSGKKKSGKKKSAAKTGKKTPKKKRKAKVPKKRNGKKRKKTKRPPKSISPLVSKTLDKKHKAAPKFDACSAEIPEPPPGKVSAVLQTDYAWPNGSTLRIGFLDGSLEARKAVRDMALRWTEHANLTFDFILEGTGSDLDIIIKFEASACNSYVGTSSRYSAEWGDATMNLCNMDEQIGSPRFQRVVLHEFGHALGLKHEHQNPNVEFEWNYDYVYNYYATYSGWDRARTDRNVFEPIDPAKSLASEHDPDSVMHYSFPPEFTKDGTWIGGKNEISKLDAEHMAKWYPKKSKDKVKTFSKRRLAVWNRTSEKVAVRVVYETQKKKSGKWVWSPSSDARKGVKIELGPGMKKFVPKAAGRRAKLVATNDFGDRWSADEKVASSYEASKIETFTLEVEGAPDTPPSKSPDELYDSANDALSNSKYKLARKRFRAFAKRYPSDDRVPWARFNLMLAWYQAGHYQRSIQAGYDLITDMPDEDAADFAWFYGGAASFELGQCENARAYFEFVKNPEFGLPKDWQKAAKDYIKAIDTQSDKYCR